MGELDEAIKDYNKAIELDPDNAEAYNNLADLWLRMNNYDIAMKNINIAIEKNSKLYIAFVTRGEILMAIEKINEAIEDFNLAIWLNNDYRKSYENRAKCYRKLAEMEQDAEKKSNLIAKAETDEKKARTLKETD